MALSERTPIYTFCAIGNSDSFTEQLATDGYDAAHSRDFPDHHWYSQSEIDEMAEDAASYQAKALVTTAKDAVKLRELRFRMPCYVAEIEPEIDDAEKFARFI